MSTAGTPKLDARRAQEIYQTIVARRAGYGLAGWHPKKGEPGQALARIVSRYLETVVDRLNQAPDKNRLKFFEILGVEQIPAQAARVPVVFNMAKDAPDGHLPAGSQVAAPPPPEESDQIVFETERALGLTSARIRKLVTLWPGRDQYIDHTEDFLAGEPVRPFSRPELVDTPHHFYLAHDTLLNLGGNARVVVELELRTGSSEHLSMAWEYWDGAVWRRFDQVDGTDGMQHSGRLVLTADCAETEKTEIDGCSAYWIRARLEETLPVDPERTLPSFSRVRLSSIVERGGQAHLDVLQEQGPEVGKLGHGRIEVKLSLAAGGDAGSPPSGARATLTGPEGKVVPLPFKDGTASFDMAKDLSDAGHVRTWSMDVASMDVVGARGLALSRGGVASLWGSNGPVKALPELGTGLKSASLASTGVGALVVTSGGNAQIWRDIENIPEPGRVLADGATFAVMSRDGRWAIAITDKGHTLLWDVKKKEAEPQLIVDQGATGAAFAPQGDRFLILTEPGVQLWRIVDDKPKRLGDDLGDKKPVAGSFAPDGKSLLTVGEGGALVLWSELADSPKPVRLFARGVGREGAAFTPDGSRIIVARDKTLKEFRNPFSESTGVEYTHTHACPGVAYLDIEGRMVVAWGGKIQLHVTELKPRHYTLTVSALGHEFESRLTTPAADFPIISRVAECRLYPRSSAHDLLPDSAFSDAEPLDVTRPFFPFGQQPRPGSAFYFSAAEVLSKPGARLRVHVVKAETAQEHFGVHPPAVKGVNEDVTQGPLHPKVVWEYWAGAEWRALELPSAQSEKGAAIDDVAKSDLTTDGHLDFRVPDDILPTKVNDIEALWIRVRVVSGVFGWKASVKVSESQSLTYVIHQPPAVSDFRLSYYWRKGPYPLQRSRVYSGFEFTNEGRAARSGRPIQPFRQLLGSAPGLYIGLERPLPVDRVGLYADVVARPLTTDLAWEYSSSSGWRELKVEDGTAGLRASGVVSFIGPVDGEIGREFGEELHWIRVRHATDDVSEFVLRSLHVNAAWAAQRQTLEKEPLGAGTGLPNQSLRFGRIPVLADEWLEVRESVGKAARVEWRLIAAQLLDTEAQIEDLERRVADEDTQLDIQVDRLRLVRDREKKVSEVWVRWTNVPNFYGSGQLDRHYTLDRIRGRARFGDGQRGRTLPAEARLVARTYRSGGGRKGNVAGGAVTQLLTGVGGVEGITNPRAAEGGSDSESLPALGRRAPGSVVSRGRALTARDYETLALESTGAIAVARALPCRRPGGQVAPGWLTLVVIPESRDPRPWPSAGLRRVVQRYIEARMPASVAASGRLHVTGPEYREVGARIQVKADSMEFASHVARDTRSATELFLHPLRGGPAGRGWAPGQAVSLSDLAVVLERLPHVDVVVEAVLSVGGKPGGERLEIDAGEVVVAGRIDVEVVS